MTVRGPRVPAHCWDDRTSSQDGIIPSSSRGGSGTGEDPGMHPAVIPALNKCTRCVTGTNTPCSGSGGGGTCVVTTASTGRGDQPCSYQCGNKATQTKRLGMHESPGPVLVGLRHAAVAHWVVPLPSRHLENDVTLTSASLPSTNPSFSPN